MVPVVAQIALENRNTFAVAKLNIKDGRQTLRKYPIRQTPTYMVFQDGERVAIFAGVIPKAQMLQKILSVIDVE
ncbi:MAG: thioredoxin domain-containing protein [Candidatus Poribacteria bacterium]|nr:thioredoxin domain-containing protein [Candidatus Poribacteria bacterium]